MIKTLLACVSVTALMTLSACGPGGTAETNNQNNPNAQNTNNNPSGSAGSCAALDECCGSFNDPITATALKASCKPVQDLKDEASCKQALDKYHAGNAC